MAVGTRAKLRLQAVMVATGNKDAAFECWLWLGSCLWLGWLVCFSRELLARELLVKLEISPFIHRVLELSIDLLTYLLIR